MILIASLTNLLLCRLDLRVFRASAIQRKHAILILLIFSRFPSRNLKTAKLQKNENNLYFFIFLINLIICSHIRAYSTYFEEVKTLN